MSIPKSTGFADDIDVPIPINFTGLNDVITLLESHNVNVQAIPEGTVIRPRDRYGVPVPFFKDIRKIS